MLGVSPLKKQMRKRSKEKFPLSTFWWHVDMEMSVRLRRRLGEGQEMGKEVKNSVHHCRDATLPLNFDP